MKKKPNILFAFFLTCYLFIQLGGQLHGQSSYFKFPVTEAGIYKLSKTAASQLGGATLENIAFYGNHGMLPQKLDSAAFQLHEIPSFHSNDHLYVYLEGPHTLHYTDDSLRYTHHHYVDTAYYLIQTGVPTPKRIPTSSPENNAPSATAPLYAIYPFKKETTNLLSSGRKWYGNRVMAGGLTSFNMLVEPYDQAPVFYQANVMAQSTTTAKLSLRSQQNTFFTASIDAVPNTTYGLKGGEKLAQGFLDHFEVGNPTQFNIELESTDPNAAGYLDYFLLGLPHGPHGLRTGEYFHLTSGSPVSVMTEQGLMKWDITLTSAPISLSDNGGNLALEPGQRMIVADPEKIATINSIRPVNMEARHVQAAKLIIITAPSLLFQVNKLADHKRKKGISTAVVTTQEIYDAYNYGTRDVTAIRNFLADHYHKNKTLEHVLLFGKGTFDYKNNSAGRPNLVPVYSSRNSLHPLTSYSSDDYYGFLEFGQGEWAESEQGDLSLSIGVGRIPVINFEEARNVVEKIIHYENHPLQLGEWKRKMLFVADDGDNNIHLRHSETHATTIHQNSPSYQIDKLYLDGFDQSQEGNYQSAPEAKAALAQIIEEGTLLVNYIGHGNESTLAAERVFQVSDLENWPISDHFPLIITATCEFGRHDSPYLRSGAEELLMAKDKGAIGLLTTGRPVYSSLNFELNKAFIAAFQQKKQQPLTLGDIFKATKNNSLNGSYNRNFSLLGDPSLALAIPELQVQWQIQSKDGTPLDTIPAGEAAIIQGSIIDPVTGLTVENFEGEYLLEILDEPHEVTTLGDEGPPGTYHELNQTLYRGVGQISNGRFLAEIMINPSIDNVIDQGQIRVFASSQKSSFEAMAAKKIPIAEGDETNNEDQLGPTIHLFANDSLNSTRTTSSTEIMLLANLYDTSGIQITKSLQHGISLSVNGHSPISLSDYFRAFGEDYRRGHLEIPVSGLEEGLNTLTLVAYDNAGNSNSQSIQVEVYGSTHLRITEFINYPNPTNDISYFKIKHNRSNENIILNLDIYSLTGSTIFSMEKRYPKAENEITDIEWIFLRNKTKIPAKGTYIYKLRLTSERDGTSDQAIGKINIQ
ncbi:peptidase C25 [Echinicola strongylocentroti]|uniref:Peptidase C25 n=1 Tax=Echinicola strongylocentroti TaxID=1795355 RepID=A0A2Z4IMI1_9BACT|nr:type IX secretion system sortase PorU [Echinicola strongylocentroti]AWW32322.1 peptidase C25 [Echinicola strongylocentroti]